MKKFLTFIIILVLLALVVFLGFKLLDKGESNENEIIDNTVNEEQNNTSNNKSDSNTTSQSEENQEYNTTIYIGTEDNFEEFTVNIDKSGSATYQASQILEAIGDILGYRLIANDITDGKGGMTIGKIVFTDAPSVACVVPLRKSSTPWGKITRRRGISPTRKRSGSSQ